MWYPLERQSFPAGSANLSVATQNSIATQSDPGVGEAGDAQGTFTTTSACHEGVSCDSMIASR